jgi:hypothetical protein
MELTVNQLLDTMSSRFGIEQIRNQGELRTLWDKLWMLKIRNIHGGMIRIRNSVQILDKIKSLKGKGV